MVRFYASLIRDIPTVLRGTHEAWAYWLLTLIVPIVLWIWPELRPMTDTPWLIGAPIALSVLYGMLRVNYVRFQTAEATANELRDKLSTALTDAPNFEGNVDAIAVAEFNHGPTLAALISVTNNGRVASTLQDWQVYLDGQMTPKIAFNSEDSIVITSDSAESTDKINTVEIKPADFIPEKTFPTAIIPGGGQRGWLMTALPPDHVPETVRVTCSDIRRRSYTFELTSVTSRGPYGVTRLGYWAGVSITHRVETNEELEERGRLESGTAIGSNDWSDMEQRFTRISGEVDGCWNVFPVTGEVRWAFYPRSDEGDTRTLQHFKSEAARAGNMVAKLVRPPAKFAGEIKDPVDRWLNTVAALAHPGRGVTGNGIEDGSYYESFHIERLVGASKIACSRLGSGDWTD